MNTSQSVPPANPESLNQLSKVELVGMLLAQQKVIEQLQQKNAQLLSEIEKLKISRDLDSKTSSKPPSQDLLKKPEKAKSGR